MTEKYSKEQEKRTHYVYRKKSKDDIRLLTGKQNSGTTFFKHSKEKKTVKVEFCIQGKCL